MKILRDLAHVIIGWAIAYQLAHLNLIDLAGKLTVGIMVTASIAGVWEMFQEHWNRIKHDGASTYDYKDIIRTAIGGALGAITAHYFSNTYLDILSWVLIVSAPLYVILMIKFNKPV